MRKNNIVILILITVCILSVGCGQFSAQEQVASIEAFSEKAYASEGENVINLPERLFKSFKNSTALSMNHDFEIDEPTDFSLNIVNHSGALKLEITDKNTGSCFYSYDFVDSEYTENLKLPEGIYTLNFELSNFTGSYELVNENTY